METAPSTSGFRHACRAARLGSLPCRLGIPFVLYCSNTSGPNQDKAALCRALHVHAARRAVS